VQVAPAGGGYQIDNVEVSTAAAANAQRQVSAVGDPEVGAAYQRVRNATPAADDYGAVVRPAVSPAAPLPTREYHGGAAPFDTGLLTVVAGAPALVTTAADQWLDALLLSNQTGEVQEATLTDGASAAYGVIVLQPSELRVVPLHGMKFSGGVKLGAGAASAVKIQAKGTR
jgi:hypothetical protein